MGSDYRNLHPQGCGRTLDGAQHTDLSRLLQVEDDGKTINVRRNLLEHFQHFLAGREFGKREAGDVAARMRQASHIANGNRVGDLHEHDWYGVGLALQVWQYQSAATEDHIGFEAD